MQLEQIINDKAVVARYVSDPTTAIPFLGETLFPNDRASGLTLEWAKGYNGLPAALRPSTLDVQPALRDRLGAESILTEMPFFREQMTIREKERQQLLEINNAASPTLKAVVARIYNDAAALVGGARVQRERMRMQLLYSGSIAITAPDDNGRKVNYTIDYDDSKGTWKKSHAGFKFDWSNPATSTPLEDINKIKEAANAEGLPYPTRAIASQKIVAQLTKSVSIRKYMNPVGYTNMAPLSDSDVLAYVARQTGITIVAYDKNFKDVDGKVKKYWPDDKISFFVGGNLGKTWFGTTPEEADLANGGQPGVSVSIVDTGVAVATWKDSRNVPVQMVTNVSQLCVPSFEAMDNVFVATIKVE